MSEYMKLLLWLGVPKGELRLIIKLERPTAVDYGASVTGKFEKLGNEGRG